MASSGATGDRAETEALIEAAALELLDSKGVLAGLNLREAADLAKVNRGLVYLYFGSRQALLRSALMKRGAETPVWNSPRRDTQPFPERAASDLAEMATVGDQVRLFTLLHLDGAPDLAVMPHLKHAMALLERDRAEGSVPPDSDLQALHVLLVALSAGYTLFRDRFAAETGSTAEDLDARVSRLLGDLLERAARDSST